MAQFYDYKDKKSYKVQDFSCSECDWRGTGDELAEGQDSPGGYGFIVLCPECRQYIGWIDTTVSIYELSTYGSEADKDFARERKEFWNNWRETSLKHPDQLPDIDAGRVIVRLCEESKDTGKTDDADIVLYWDGKEIWREMRLYEYYGRYLQIGKILIEKYGNRLVDFEAENTWALCGDDSLALKKVSEFRELVRINHRFC